MNRMLNGLSKKNKITIITSVASAVLLLVVMICALFARAWFTNTLSKDIPAKISNFVVRVSYSKDNGGTWTSISSNEAIPLDSLEDVDNLSVRVTYQGFSAAYLRVSLHGSFYNKYTQTVLPQPEHFWTFEPSVTNDWNRLNDGEYWYYTSLLHNMDQSKTNDITELSTLEVTFDKESLGDISAYQEYNGSLYILVDAVQPDRCEAFWGVPPSSFAVSS